MWYLQRITFVPIPQDVLQRDQFIHPPQIAHGFVPQVSDFVSVFPVHDCRWLLVLSPPLHVAEHWLHWPHSPHQPGSVLHWDCSRSTDALQLWVLVLTVIPPPHVCEHGPQFPHVFQSPAYVLHVVLSTCFSLQVCVRVLQMNRSLWRQNRTKQSITWSSDATWSVEICAFCRAENKHKPQNRWRELSFRSEISNLARYRFSRETFFTKQLN